MGRGSGRSSGRGSASRPSATATRPSQRPQTAVQQKPNPSAAPAQKPGQQAPPQQQAPAAPVQQSSGPGLLGTIGSVAAGSLIGNVLADKFRGSDAPAEAAPAAAGGMPAYDQVNQHPCYQFRFNFDSCVSQNQANIASCQWTWDSYKECMNANNQNPNNWS